MSANDDNDENLENLCVTPSANDMVVSDDDSATVNKTLKTTSSPSCASTDSSSYSGSDDETIIESEQPLCFETTHPVSQNRSNNADPLLDCDVDVDGEDDDLMAKFLQDTFEPNVPVRRNCLTPSLTASTFEDVLLDASEMDALLNAENDAMMLLPDLCMES